MAELKLERLLKITHFIPQVRIGGGGGKNITLINTSWKILVRQAGNRLIST